MPYSGVARETREDAVEAANPFAQAPPHPEPIIARIRDELARDCEAGRLRPTGDLERMVDDAVRQLWGSRVRTFVSILALRQVREELATGAATAVAGASTRGNERPARRRDEDELILDRSDVLTLDDGGMG